MVEKKEQRGADKVQHALETPEEKRPALSEDFYRQLLQLPACKTSGICDGCGRCEH